MPKVEHLYHASPHVNLEILSPHNEYPRHAGEQNLVFATPHIELAAMFLVPRTLSIEICVYEKEYVVFIESNETELQEVDHGGAIYKVSSEFFETDITYGMVENEWYSKLPVKPVSKHVFNSSVEAIAQYGVKHFYVNQVQMAQIRLNPSIGFEIVLSIEDRPRDVVE